MYALLGQYDKALAETEAEQRLEPTIGGYGNLAGIYINVDRLKDARQTLQEAQQKNFDGLIIRSDLYSLAFLSGDRAEMERQVTWAAGRPGEEDQMLSLHADTEAYYGRLEKARDLSRRAVDSAVRADAKETAALWLIFQALREAEVGNVTAARASRHSRLALAPGRDVKVRGCFGAGAHRRNGSIQDYSGGASKVRTHEHSSQSLLVSGDRGLHCYGTTGTRPGNCCAGTALPYELGGHLLGTAMYPAYVRGQAYLGEKNSPAAAAEFQKFLDHPGIVSNCLLASLAHLQLGRAYAISGDTVKAKAAYQDFLTLWKDADPDIPILKEAKAEYAKLQ